MKLRMLSAAVVSFCAFTAGAQTKFDQNLEHPDLTTYTHIDECDQYIKRQYAILKNQHPIWIDTVEFSYDIPSYLQNNRIDSVGLSCLSKFRTEDLPSEHNLAWAGIYLNVGQVDMFEKLFTQLIDSVDIKEKASYYGRLFQLSDLRLHGDLYPRLFTRSLKDIPIDSAVERVFLISAYASSQVRAGNLFAAADAATQLMDEINAAPKEMRESNDFKVMLMLSALQVILHSTYQEGLDSIRSGTDAYYLYYRNIMRQMMNDTTIDSIPSLIGKKIPQLSGDFYFDGTSDSVSDTPFQAPITGRPSLLVRLDGSCHSSKPNIQNGRTWPGGGRNCISMAAGLRRVLKHFPDLDVTIVSTTFGILGDGQPMSTRDEAILLRKYIKDHFGIRGRMLVVETPFHRIQAPDNRRVDLPSSLDQSFQESGTGVGSAEVVLLDSDGRFILATAVYGDEEPRLIDAIKAVMAR